MADQPKPPAGSALDAVQAGPGATAAPPARLQATRLSHPSVDALRARFGTAVVHHEVSAGDQHVIYVAPARNLEILRWLKEDQGQRFDLLADVTAVDFGGGRPLQVVYQLWSIPHRRGLRVKCELALTALEIDSVVPLWRTADWLEREVYDLFGIHFDHHPDLRRILLPADWAGHPLRKEHDLEYRENDWVRRHLAIREVHPETDQTGKYEMTEFVKANR